MELITGLVKIKSIGAVEDVGTQGFQKRDVVVTTEDQYPQTIMFQFDGGHINKPDAFKPDDLVNISFNLKGREWVNPQGETKVFNTLQGWKIVKPGAEQQPTQAAQQTSPMPTAQEFESPSNFNEEEHDDLAF